MKFSAILTSFLVASTATPALGIRDWSCCNDDGGLNPCLTATDCFATDNPDSCGVKRPLSCARVICCTDGDCGGRCVEDRHTAFQCTNPTTYDNVNIQEYDNLCDRKYADILSCLFLNFALEYTLISPACFYTTPQLKTWLRRNAAVMVIATGAMELTLFSKRRGQLAPVHTVESEVEIPSVPLWKTAANKKTATVFARSTKKRQISA